ncbi:hypothetical protein FOZ62_027265 [Perkinsus olseni]|uniref:Peroxisomal membrane protein receptor Pex19 n=1 Tax=Perkinsus olseni TaxID=32597 RepID=A0A7J6PWB3_PEROL|nr:hypothetical protein FOZ62_027265 [Perkinsus olseni]
MPVANPESSPELSDELDDLIEFTLKEMDNAKAEEGRGTEGSQEKAATAAAGASVDGKEQASTLEQGLNDLVKGLEESAQRGGEDDEEDLQKLMEAMRKLDLGDDEEFMKEINGLTKGMFAKEAIREPIVKIRDGLQVFLASDEGKNLDEKERERCTLILRKYAAVLEVYDKSEGDSLTDAEQKEASRLFGELQALGPPPEEVVERIVPPTAATAAASSSSGGEEGKHAAAPASKEDAEEFAQFLKGMGFGSDTSASEGNPAGMDEESAKVMKEMIDNPDLLRQMMGDLDKAMQDASSKDGGGDDKPPQCCIM